MNERSLTESNAILEVAISRAGVGELITASPGELADAAGVENRLSAARAVRALISRGRIRREGESYRLIDGRPLEPGEKATVRPAGRRRRARAQAEPDKPTYERVGMLIVERLIETSAENAELRTAVERARSEAEAARREAMEVTRGSSADRRRTQALEDEITSLKRQLEMAESNMRSLLEAAKSRPAQPMQDSDAKAILDILSSKAPVE